METAFNRLRARFLLAILAGDVHAARSVVDAARAEGADEDATVIGVIRPALHEVGVRWASAEIGVAQEHVASATAAIALEHLAERAAPDGDARAEAPLAIVCCVEGELHALGARAVADALERHGWVTLYCGASTPVHDVVELAREREARLVALSVARRSRLPVAAETVARLHELDPAPTVLVGGQACLRAEDCPTADIVHVGADFRALVRRLRETVA